MAVVEIARAAKRGGTFPGAVRGGSNQRCCGHARRQLLPVLVRKEGEGGRQRGGFSRWVLRWPTGGLVLALAMSQDPHLHARRRRGCLRIAKRSDAVDHCMALSAEVLAKKCCHWGGVLFVRRHTCRMENGSVEVNVTKLG
jgi:hypothetical protein